MSDPDTSASGATAIGADATLLFDVVHGNVRGNAAAARHFGLPDDQLADLPLARLGERLDGGTAAALLSALDSLTHDGAPLRVLPLLTRDGQPFDLALERLPGASAPHVIGSLHPSPLHSGDETARAAHASLAVLAGGIAHDFNNLLVGVMGNLDLARYADDVGIGTQRHLDAALAAAERAAELCRQLLAFSGRGPVRTQVKDLNEELRRIAPLLRQSVGRGTALDIAPADGPLPAALDSGLFIQLVLNLLANAAEATAGTGSIRIATQAIDWPTRALEGLRWIGHAPAPGAYVQLCVSDDGAGMSEHLQARVFEPLFSTRGEGRGLGLPAVQGIVRQHGGCVGLRSQVPGGTTVAVLWPAAHGAAVQQARAPRRAREGTILIVDDEPTVRDVLQLQLERLGYRTRAVENGLLALEHVRAHADELLAVVLDQTMPVMGGAEAYRRLREVAPQLPVVLTTGYGEENLLELIASDPHAAFLPKPFALGRLREVLEHVTS